MPVEESKLCRSSFSIADELDGQSHFNARKGDSLTQARFCHSQLYRAVLALWWTLKKCSGVNFTYAMYPQDRSRTGGP